MFLNQRQAAVDASLKSDIKQMMLVQENWLIKNSAAGNTVALFALREPNTPNPMGSHNRENLPYIGTPGNYIKVPGNGKGGYCIYAWNPNASVNKTENTPMTYNTVDGIIGSSNC